MTGIKEEPLDLPPPYSLSEDEPSYTPVSSVSPPDYNTIHEQTGFLGPSSSSTSVGTSKLIKREKEEEDYRPNKSNHHNGIYSLLDDIRYDTNRGPIGNILGISGRLVGNATNAANIAMGASPSHSPAVLGNNVARSASVMANNASKAAMSYVEDLMNGSNGKRNETRDRKGKRREIDRSLRSPSYNSSRISQSLPIIPPLSPPPVDDTLDHDEHGILEIEKKNAALELNQSWSGEKCRLKVTNGQLSVHGSLKATDSIELTSKNGTITVDGELLATKTIIVRSDNATFRVNGRSVITKELDVLVSNAPIQFDSIIQADTISLKTRNGPIHLDNIYMGSELYVKTTNAPIEIQILDIGHSSAKIEVESSNAPVNVHLPSTFSGYFSAKSNSNGTAKIIASQDPSLIEYEVDTPTEKAGICRNLGNKSNNSITIKTSNSAANLYL